MEANGKVMDGKEGAFTAFIVRLMYLLNVMMGRTKVGYLGEMRMLT